MNSPSFFRRIVIGIFTWWLNLKWKILGDYYTRVAVQAHYLYERSELFHERWQNHGLDFARNPAKGELELFFRKAQSGPLRIRMQFLYDAIVGRPYTPYYLAADSDR